MNATVGGVQCLPCEREVARRSRDGGIQRPQKSVEIRGTTQRLFPTNYQIHIVPWEILR